HRPNEARDSADAGLAINQNFAPFYSARDGAEISVGRFEQAKADVLQAMRLSPRDPEIGYWHMQLGAAELGLQHFDVDIEEQRKAINAGDRTFIPYVQLAAAYALIGKSDDAKAALTEARRLNPNLTVKWMIAHAPNYPILFEGLRKAGLPEDEAGPTKHLSIVVLPFTNLSGDPKQDYFADGITENLTTDLSRIRNSFVIARNTAFTYKGKNVNAKEIGKELGVRYVLEGSVQRDGNRVRVNAQLIDAESGSHLWADRFEEDLADLFKLQDDVVARLANTLGYELVKAEAAKSVHSANPDAIDLTMRGLALVQLLQSTKENNAAGRAWFDEALKIDPNDADALSGEAMSYLNERTFGSTATQTDYDTKILGLADRAIALNPNTMRAYLAKSYYLLLSRRTNEALSAADAGLAVNPNFAALYAARRGAEMSLGRFEQAMADMEKAMRLSPRDPEIGFWHMGLGAV